MSETTQERAEVLRHATCIAEYIERHTTLSADGAYNFLMSYINALEDANKPRTVEDVLMDVINEAFDDEDGYSVICKRYADELRELMEVE